MLSSEDEDLDGESINRANELEIVALEVEIEDLEPVEDIDEIGLEDVTQNDTETDEEIKIEASGSNSSTRGFCLG